NTALIELPDGGHGRLFVQKTPPSVMTLSDVVKGSVQPDLKQAKWIWSGNSGACHVRKMFHLDHVPDKARLTVSAYSGYRIFVNGVKVDEEIGPWSNWKKPETFNIAGLLRSGKNVISIWGQLFAGQNVNKGADAFRSRGIVLAMKTRDADGTSLHLVTDGTWKGEEEEVEGWQTSRFDDSGWKWVSVVGEMGDSPWGWEVVHHIGSVSKPRRPLSIHLDSPYLECFDEVPDIIYDVKKPGERRVGWYRFDCPPGVKQINLPGKVDARIWLNGNSVEVRNQTAFISTPPADVSKAVVRIEMDHGAYAGAAFPQPVSLTLEGGSIQPGLWSDYALPTYSGIGVYSQNVNFTSVETNRKITLDLGQVLVAAEVLVNGESVGVRLARPFKFDLSGIVREGENTLTLKIANTIAPHYRTIPAMNLGPTDSGLIGPVNLWLN
ncbi:MAG TPA: hypothetical protein EYG38_07930, partial [Verrucomicrobia bacterium]|nr:hypothetical protein [Verrucomicrobiota bacterium]